MTVAYKEVLTQLNDMEADMATINAEIEEKQATPKEGILSNIKEARSLIVFINNTIDKTKDKALINELDELKIKLEEVIETSEQTLKEYCI